MNPNQSKETAPSSVSWKTYLGLCKLKVVGHIVFTAVIGMFLAVPGWPPLPELWWGSVGIGLAAASAAALNHLLDREADAAMARTQNRPLPQGQVQPREVILFAAALGVSSMLILGLLVNVLTMILTLLSLIG
ncbi:MAG: hypothetical protein RLZZ226_110, partial [Pseudomonadota bacterium]